MSTNDTYLAVFTGSKNNPRLKEWMALPDAERQAKEKEGIAAWKGVDGKASGRDRRHRRPSR